MNNSNGLAAYMRMGIGLAGLAMRGPTGMGNPGDAVERVACQTCLQVFDLAQRTHACQRIFRIEHHHTRRVIAAIFEAFQSFDQDGDDIPFSYSTYNSTHGVIPSVIYFINDKPGKSPRALRDPFIKEGSGGFIHAYSLHL